MAKMVRMGSNGSSFSVNVFILWEFQLFSLLLPLTVICVSRLANKYPQLSNRFPVALTTGVFDGEQSNFRGSFRLQAMSGNALPDAQEGYSFCECAFPTRCDPPESLAQFVLNAKSLTIYLRLLEK